MEKLLPQESLLISFLIGQIDSIKYGKQKMIRKKPIWETAHTNRRKRKSIENRYMEAEITVGDMSDIYALEKEDPTKELFVDKTDMENLIYFLPEEEVTILVLKYLGYSYKETYKIMGVKSLTKYYELYNSLKLRIMLFKSREKDN